MPIKLIMKSVKNLDNFSARHKSKLMILAVLTGVIVGALAIFEKPLLKAATDFFGSC